jgi:ATP-binding cassette subfamily D (ALD) protein 3
LINLAKAIGRIVVSYKDMQNLAGYTTLIHEMDEVLDDLRSGTYVRTQVVEKEIDNDTE